MNVARIGSPLGLSLQKRLTKPWLSWLAACALAGCTADRADEGRGSPSGDAGIVADAGAIAPGADAGPVGDAGGPHFDDRDASPPELEFSGPDLETALARCFNGEDDDGDGRTDCADPSCQAFVPACCVGASTSMCCTAQQTEELPIADCLGDIGACEALSALGTPFGTPAPTVEAEGERRVFIARGDTTDSGLMLSAPIDLRAETLSISATIATGGAAHQEATDFIAVGLVDADGPEAPVRVAPRVGIMVSGNRNEVGLLIAGELVMRKPLEDGAFHEYTLTSRPDGAIELLQDGELLGTATLPLDQSVRAVIYGRSFGTMANDPLPTRLETLRITNNACDAPAAMITRGTLSFPELDAIGTDLRRVGAPSLVHFLDASGEVQERMALEVDGAIHLARSTENGWKLMTPLEEPALAPAHWAERLGEPALRWTGDALELFFTAFGMSGEGHVARVRASEGSERFAWEDVEVLLAPNADVESVRGPAPFTFDGTDHLAVREDVAGRARIALYGLEPIRRLRVVREPSTDLFAFDRDEVAAPAVLVTDDVIRLYFTGRRGASFGIGLIVSPDAVHWTEPHGGALVLAASPSGFDALGVSDPEPVLQRDALHLYYTGLDGERARIGLAVGPAPSSH